MTIDVIVLSNLSIHHHIGYCPLSSIWELYLLSLQVTGCCYSDRVFF